jgi:hypothetical protein
MYLNGLWSALRGGRTSPSPHPDDFPNDHYTRPRHSRRRTNGSSGDHRAHNKPRSNSSATVLCGLFKMPPLFNLIRIGVFGEFILPFPPRCARRLLIACYSICRSWTVTVLLWTIIVLAISIHFQGILLTNDLSACLALVFSMGQMRNVKLTCPPLARFIPFAIFVCAATIVLLLALCVPPLYPRSRLSQKFSPGLFPDCSSVSGKPTRFRQESNLGVSALTVYFG